MEERFFIFSDTKKNTDENIIYIGEKGDYKSLESYLRDARGEFVYDFTKNHLSKKYFSDEDCFISFVHENPLQLRLLETLIPRKSLVIVKEDLDLDDAILNKFQYEEEDYDIFSGQEVVAEDLNYNDLIKNSIKDLFYVLYQMLDCGYLETDNVDKVDDWIATFQEPILDIFIRYHRLETSAEDITTADEFLINPEYRKTMCIMLMKVLSNFLVNNDLLTEEITSNFTSWEDKNLWYSLREKVKLIF